MARQTRGSLPSITASECEVLSALSGGLVLGNHCSSRDGRVEYVSSAGELLCDVVASPVLVPGDVSVKESRWFLGSQG
jgi:hypothetical protein